jgi:hypothetical protein
LPCFLAPNTKPKDIDIELKLENHVLDLVVKDTGIKTKVDRSRVKISRGDLACIASKRSTIFCAVGLIAFRTQLAVELLDYCTSEHDTMTVSKRWSIKMNGSRAHHQWRTSLSKRLGVCLPDFSI